MEGMDDVGVLGSNVWKKKTRFMIRGSLLILFFFALFSDDRKLEERGERRGGARR